MERQKEIYNQKIIKTIITVAEILNKKYLEVFDELSIILHLDKCQELDIKNILTNYLVESNRTTFFKNSDEERLAVKIKCSTDIARALIFQSYAIDLAEKLNLKAHGKGPVFGLSNKVAKEENLLIEYAIILFMNGCDVNKIINITQEILRNNEFGDVEIAVMLYCYLDKCDSGTMSQLERSNCPCKNYILGILTDNNMNTKRKRNEL